VTFDQLILQQRPHIEKLMRDLCRRHHLSPAEVEDFRATVYRALERNDYEALKEFDGQTTWESFMAMVVTREFFLFQQLLWGQWRPSPLANRLGPAAILLEELVVRDGVLISDAVEIMRAMHRVDLPRHRLLEFASQLRLSDTPRRGAGATPDWKQEHDIPNGKLERALRAAVAMLSPDDRLILELRFRDGQPLTRIARLMKIEARPLQRQIEQATETIRRSLLSAGIAQHDVESLLRQSDDDRTLPARKWWQVVLSQSSE
jgi:hypothetical protein